MGGGIAQRPLVPMADAGVMLPADPPDTGAVTVIDARTYSGRCEFDEEREPRTLTVPGDHDSIQEAIDAAEPGDTVRVLPGEYREHLRLRTGVSVVGSGAADTILDGDGEGQNLVDFTGAYGAELRGFTLRNVGVGEGCAAPQEVQLCSGDWYAAAIYGDGSAVTHDGDPCNNASITVADNVITGSDIGMMLYFHAYAEVADNVFTGNRVAFVANHHGSGTGVVRDNVFYGNAQLAMSLAASYLDIVRNVFVENGVAVERAYVQEGQTYCNVLFENRDAGAIALGTDGNVADDPLLVDPENGDFELDDDSPVRACVRETLPE